jgi:two-component system KDP operon response regulator KdpE
MPKPGPTAELGSVAFGDFTLDLDSGELTQNGRSIPLRRLATLALLALARRPGRLVTRHELRQQLWGSMAVEWENGLHQVLHQVRRALGDDPQAPRFVETVPGRGYRFRAATKGVGRRELGRRGTLYFLAGAVSAVALPLLFVLVCALLAR